MLAENVKKVQETLRRESAAFGHVPPRLIAVTKYVSGEETLPLQALGVTDIGENRVQVLREKLPVVSGKFSLHLIGRLQNNKVKYIIKDVCLIHSVDNLSLAQEIDRQAGKNGLRMDVLLQVNVTGESQKGGVPPEELMPLLRQVAPLPGVHVRGLMTMMPLGAERDYIFERFRATRQLLERCREEAVAGTDMTELSMGMYQDYDLAARAGATMVRVGSALWRA